MTAQTLLDNPNFFFCPAYNVEDEVQQIRIVIEGMSGYVPAALVALTVSEAEEICDNSRAFPALPDDSCHHIRDQSFAAHFRIYSSTGFNYVGSPPNRATMLSSRFTKQTMSFTLPMSPLCLYEKPDRSIAHFNS